MTMGKRLRGLTCLILPAILALALSSCTAVPTPQAARFTLLYSGNLDGELEPCGCTEEGDLGGILRQTSAIDGLREAHPDLFLVSSGGLFNSAIATDRITSRFILSGLKAQGFDAIGVQWKDLAYGAGFLEQSGLPLVASNWSGSEYARSRTIRRGGIVLAVFSWLDPQQSPYQKMQGEHVYAEPRPGALAKALQGARAAGAVTLLTSTLDPDEARARLPLEHVDVLILRSAYEQYAEPVLENGTLFLSPGSRGQRIARVQVELDSNRRVGAFAQEVISLPKRVQDSPRLASWYGEFTAALKADYRERVARRKHLAKAPSRYVGDRACKACHAEEYETWAQSRHARAFATLERVNKAFDANCLECHTVGFNREGGFVDPELTPQRLNVQCESCHGPGREHLEAAGQSPMPTPGPQGAPVCAACHNRAHSPAFDYSSYWPKILHGKPG